jgi:signal transduction histidine kinase
MARVLADGTGAEWSQVWVVVGTRPVLAASWPPGAAPDPGLGVVDPQHDRTSGRCSLPVRSGGDLLGVLVVQERSGVPLTSVERRLFEGLASQAGLVLRGTRLRAELERRASELSVRADELRVSRQRLVDAQDEGRRLLERDIHDGAQQHLVALAVNLRLADTLAPRSTERAVELLTAQESAADEAVATLLQLARGIYPPLLEDAGIVAALRPAVGTTTPAVEIIERDLGRYPLGVEAAAYFTCLEALQNAAKHSGADTVRVELRGEPGGLTLTVTDDGAGFDPGTTPPGAGLTNMRDRVESVGGALTTRSAPGGGTRIHASLPAEPLPPTDGSA